jgi:hypothetical protein
MKVPLFRFLIPEVLRLNFNIYANICLNWLYVLYSNLCAFSMFEKAISNWLCGIQVSNNSTYQDLSDITKHNVLASFGLGNALKGVRRCTV